jgi:hypothetical protein
MRVQLIGTHYIGKLIWTNGVMCGVQWDGFVEQEMLQWSRVREI